MSLEILHANIATILSMMHTSFTFNPICRLTGYYVGCRILQQILNQIEDDILKKYRYCYKINHGNKEAFTRLFNDKHYIHPIYLNNGYEIFL